MAHPKPPWLKVKAPGGPRYNRIKARARDLGLHTVWRPRSRARALIRLYRGPPGALTFSHGGFE